MRAIETSASFDESGKIILENSPALKNKKVKLLILIEEDNDEEFYSLSAQGIAKSYSANEPEYDFSLLKEPNANYEGR